ncbi:class I SAM-dependent methyltransferase [Listeria monocytogenes]|nr:class I SAM-dependent methyltransferase [Listeria monocytogenes]
MNKETERKLAASLTSQSIEILPFIPYFLQDFFELGSSPKDITYLIKQHMPLSAESNILDLACGKGAVSIGIAKELGNPVKGIDLIPAFIEEAKCKAKEAQVESLCQFEVGDVNKSVQNEKNYDAVIFGAAADILGNPAETLEKLQGTVKEGGYIIIDEAYVPELAHNNQVKYQNYEYLTRNEWLNLFEQNQLQLVEELEGTAEVDFELEKQHLLTRANELIQQYPEKKALFEGYLKSQWSEYDDLEEHLIAVTWILHKK